MSMGFQDNPNNILGADSSNNQFSSTNVGSNADGSMIERLEYIQGVVAGITAGQVILQGAADAGTDSKTVIPIAALAAYGNDFFNNQFYMQILCNKNAAGVAPEKETRKITDYVSTTGTFTCDAFSANVEATDLCLILHESQVCLGSDNANNVYDSSTVAANVDGSILERLEDLKDKVVTIDDFVDTEITALQADVTLIKGYVGGTDSASTVLGANDNNNGYVSDAVVANADGSVLERLEDLKDRVDTIDDFLDTEVAAIKVETDQIGTIVNAGGTATIGGVLGDFANVSAVTRFTNVQTEANKIGVIVNAGGTATIGGVLGDFANVTAVARFAAIKIETDQIGTIVNAGGTATIGGVLGDFANVAAVTRFTNVQTEVNKIGTIVNAGGTASIGGVLGDFANVSAVTRFGNIQTALNNFTYGGGIGTGIVRKTVTFSNTAVDTNLFTITGTVIVRLIAICDTNCESAGGCTIGVDAGTAALIADTACTSIEAGDIWHDAAPDASVEATTVMKEYIIAAGTTIVLDVEGAKQVDSGAITFMCFYTPVSVNGAIVAA